MREHTCAAAKHAACRACTLVRALVVCTRLRASAAAAIIHIFATLLLRPWHADVSVSLSACLPGWLPTRLPACLPACASHLQLGLAELKSATLLSWLKDAGFYAMKNFTLDVSCEQHACCSNTLTAATHLHHDAAGTACMQCMPAPCTAAESSCATNRQAETCVCSAATVVAQCCDVPITQLYAGKPQCCSDPLRCLPVLTAAAPFHLQGNTTIDLAHHGK